jgi:3-dehydroquinate dehydratase
MLKKQTTVANFIRRQELLSKLAIVAFDNPGEGDDPSNTGDDFDESKLPEEMKESFKKFKQGLIDKGVNIGVAREKERFEKSKGSEVEEFLKEQGLSKDDIAKLKPYLGKGEAINKILESYGVENIDDVVTAIETAEREGMTELERYKSDNEKQKQTITDLTAQINTLKESLTSEKTSKSDKEKKLMDFIEKTVVNSAIRSAAIEAGAYDAEDVLERVKSQVRLDTVDDDYVPVVVNEKGEKRFDANGDPITIQSLVQDFLEKKPHLRKSNLQSGSGSSGGGKGGVSTGTFTQEQLKDPKFFQEHYNEIMQEVRSGKLKLK